MKRTDAQLVEAFRAGDESAFEELLGRYRGMTRQMAGQYYAVGYSYEDLVLEAEVGVWEAAQCWNGKSSFRGWVHFVAKRKILTLVKLSTRRKSRPLRTYTEMKTIFPSIEAGDLGGTVEDPAEVVILREDIREALAGLPHLTDLERDVLYGVTLFDRSYQSLADEAGTTKKRIDNALQRARRKISEGASTCRP